jgi:hypothetical protein
MATLEGAKAMMDDRYIDPRVDVRVDPFYIKPVEDTIGDGIALLNSLIEVIRDPDGRLTLGQKAKAWGAIRDIAGVLRERADEMYNEARANAEAEATPNS